jgi:hypothetical protein
MFFSARSYFAGVAALILTMALGFGGGVMMTHALIGGREAARSQQESQIADNTSPASTQVESPQIDSNRSMKVGSREQNRDLGVKPVTSERQRLERRHHGSALRTVGQMNPDAVENGATQSSRPGLFN